MRNQAMRNQAMRMRSKSRKAAFSLIPAWLPILLSLSSVPGMEAQEAAPGGPITAADINALRAVAETRDPNGCSSVFRWTDDPIVPGQTPVKADHIIELRRAINEMVRGVCPTIHEQVTFEGVRLHDQSGGYHLVDGFVLNSGSTRISGRGLYVRVRFFDANNNRIAEETNYLRDGNQTLEAQQRRRFWVRFSDSEIQGWATFEVTSFEVDQRPVLCSGCARRYARQRSQVTVDGVRLLDTSGGNNLVEGFVQNSGLTRIVGTGLYVRVRFFDENDNPIADETNYLRDGNQVLEVQQTRPFWVRISDSEIQGWATFEVVSFENDGSPVPCVGCDQRHERRLEQVTLQGVGFRDDTGGSSYVEGFVLNSGSTRIVGTGLYVRVRFFGASSAPIAEETNYLRDGNQVLEVQQTRPFWVRISDSEIQGWATFQVVAFENDGRPVTCVGCSQRHGR